jgi:hypothetical protein
VPSPCKLCLLSGFVVTFITAGHLTPETPVLLVCLIQRRSGAVRRSVVCDGGIRGGDRFGHPGRPARVRSPFSHHANANAAMTGLLVVTADHRGGGHGGVEATATPRTGR